MNEKEKEAIQITKTLVEFAGEAYIPKRNREKLQVLLNLIEKQQEEIEELQKDKKVLVKNYDKVLGTFISKDKIREKIKELLEE